MARAEHACLLSVSEEQRAEVSVRFIRTGEDAVLLGPEVDWFLRRLREDGRSPVPARPGPPLCGALATVRSGSAKLCLYDNATLGGTRRREVLAAHDTAVVAPALFDDGILRITRMADGIRLAGELDVSNRHGLLAALAGGVAVIDVRSLRFVDAGGISTLYRAVRGQVRLRYPQPVPRRVIKLVDPRAERLVCDGVR